jgi:hypothetical protein
MPDIVVSIDIWCAGCGAGLCPGTMTGSPSRGNVNENFQVEPCSRCLADARKDGRDEGYTDGLNEGRGE